MRTALLFYLKLVSDLENNGLRINQYDPYLTKKRVNVEMMTMVWYVDYLNCHSRNRLK